MANEQQNSQPREAARPQQGEQPLDRLPLVATPSNRDSSWTKDARMVNCYAERQDDGSYAVFKRPGLLEDATLSESAAAGRGVYNWNNDVFTVFGTSLYKNGTSLGTVDGTGGVYRFSINNQTSPAKLQLTNGVKAYNYDSTGGLVEITDADFVKPHVKGWAFLDGTTYYMDAAGAIRGSAIGDTTSWDALNKILAQIEPDAGVALAKQLVYVIALKSWTTEALYDAGNSTGSPLGAVQGAKVNFGCASADSVQDADGLLVWLGKARASSLQVYAMENLKAGPISTKAIERLLAGVDLTTAYSWHFKLNGHLFYGLTITAANLTLVYDLSERLWSQWTDVDGNYFPIAAAATSSTGSPIFQHATNGKVYKVDDDYTTDDGSLITVDIYTVNFDKGTRRAKMCPSAEIIADQTPGSELGMRWSEDDYQTWSDFLPISLEQPRPKTPPLGTFAKRAFNFRHRRPTKMRLYAVDLNVVLGVL